MRRAILTLATIGLLVSVSLAGHLRQSDKVAVLQTGLTPLKIDSVADYVKFKEQADVRISNNREKIVSLRARTSSGSEKINEEYALKILALEQRNDELEVRIHGATDTRRSTWLSFMRDFNYDMDELERAIKALGV